MTNCQYCNGKLRYAGEQPNVVGSTVLTLGTCEDCQAMFTTETRSMTINEIADYAPMKARLESRRAA